MLKPTGEPAKFSTDRLTLLLAIITLVVLSDAFTKQLAITMLSEDQIVAVTPFLNLRLVENTGISFGLLKATSTSSVAILLSVQFAIVAGLSWLVLRSACRWEQIAIASIIGGAVANIADRTIKHSVTDFLDLHVSGMHWPTFNVADIAISSGVILVLVTTLFRDPEKFDCTNP